MTMEARGFKVPLTERTYHLDCKVVIKKVGFENVQGKNKPAPVITQEEDEMVFLLPKEGTQKDRFFTAWLPDDDKHAEVVAWIGHPINDYCRMAVLRANHEMNEPHLKLMTKAGEDRFRDNRGSFEGFWRRKSVLLRVQPEDQDELADQADDPQ